MTIIVDQVVDVKGEQEKRGVKKQEKLVEPENIKNIILSVISI